MDRPLDENAKCVDHPQGCGREVPVGMTCKVDGNECELLGGRIWQISVRDIDGLGKMGCKIGVTRVLGYDLRLVCNRVGVMVEKSDCPDNQVELPTTTTLGSHCGGSGKLKFIDGVNNEDYWRPG